MVIKRARKDHLKSLWAEQLWGKWIGLAWSVLSVFIFFRDEIWRPEAEKSWRLISLIPDWSLSIWAAITFALLLAGVYEASYRVSVNDKKRLSIYETLSPIEIFFDSENRQGRYWSLETVMKSDNTVSHKYYRYAVMIRNIGRFTLYDVQVVSEPTGELRNSPSFGRFEITKEIKTDLHPGDERLVTVFNWPYPAIQAGMLAGSSGKWGYGGVKLV